MTAAKEHQEKKAKGKALAEVEEVEGRPAPALARVKCPASMLTEATEYQAILDGGKFVTRTKTRRVKNGYGRCQECRRPKVVEGLLRYTGVDIQVRSRGASV